ncbi:sterile alpha motif domain-containing protein 13 isoform X4 [Sceloporus undulatus]|uniref:sterile alpha motif domain-containing protein 13 isoform X4 n=1 Tax=Sceloporus undulatus TaxID=8520 RepID=UPI001C4B2B6F|nr:sterile alpha motif domain-containing protein 13 isoform X4 [Sceloporus undulatus]
MVPDVKGTSNIPMVFIDMENKENGSLDTENLVENGRPPDPADWAVTDVVNYFRTVGFEEQANAFQEQMPTDSEYSGKKCPTLRNSTEKSGKSQLSNLTQRKQKEITYKNRNHSSSQFHQFKKILITHF